MLGQLTGMYLNLGEEVALTARACRACAGLDRAQGEWAAWAAGRARRSAVMICIVVNRGGRCVVKFGSSDRDRRAKIVGGRGWKRG